MTNREVILGRIREALKIGTSPHIGGASPSPAVSPQEWLPPVGATLEEQIQLFRKNAEELKVDLHECTDLHEATALLKEYAHSNGWRKIGRHSGSLVDSIAQALNLTEVRTDKEYTVDELESCDAALTECEVLVAQTGSVMVSAPSAGGRALSVLPPHHVVLARRDQMVPDLTAALHHVQAKYSGGFPSFLSFISGPSRTGDIERILVLGAHGPKKLTILLLP